LELVVLHSMGMGIERREIMSKSDAHEWVDSGAPPEYQVFDLSKCSELHLSMLGQELQHIGGRQ